MRTLEELRGRIVAVPSLFAEGRNQVAPDTGSDGKFYTEGFSIDYSRDPNETSASLKGKYLLRKDFNRFGEISTRETHFRQSGGNHTFLKTVSSSAGGYPKGVLLDAFDGEYIEKVESTESGNTKSFVDDQGIVIRNIIDCPVRKDEEPEETTKRILWKSVTRINGAGTSNLRVEFDYSNAKKVSPGSVVKKDSVLVGSFIGFRLYSTTDVTDLQPLTHTTTISTEDPICSGTLYIKNKGRYGDALAAMMFVRVYIAYGIIQVEKHPCYYCSVTGGTGNYFLYFMVKGGTTFAFQSEGVSKNNNIEWMSIPYRPSVIATEER